MTVKELRDILGRFDDKAEVRIVDQYDESDGTYYHNAVVDVSSEPDAAGEYVVLASSEEG